MPPESPPLRLEWRDPAELAGNPANWRTHPEGQRLALSAALKEVGWAGALLYNEATRHLIDGHLRKEVASGLVPVLVGSWTEEQERLILATLDPLAAAAEADGAALAALLASVRAEDEHLAALLGKLADDNSAPAPPAEGGGGDDFDATPDDEGPCRVSPGDLWLIDGGRHRLLCGDSTKAEDVARLTGGDKVGLCFTSPPYAEQREYGGNLPPWDALMRGVFGNIPMSAEGQVLVNLGLVHRDGEWLPYWQGWVEWMRAQGWRRFGWYVWDHGHGLPGDWNGRLAPSFEFVFHFNRRALQAAKWVDKLLDSIEVNTHGSGLRTPSGVMSGVSNPEASLQPTKIPDNVWRVMRHKARNVPGHPAMFPVDLPLFALRTWPGDVYDPFLGSGTTLVTAHRLGRRCLGIEIEPRYAEVVLRRAEAEGLSVAKSDA